VQLFYDITEGEITAPPKEGESFPCVTIYAMLLPGSQMTVVTEGI
jgi:hypothetical protein